MGGDMGDSCFSTIHIISWYIRRFKRTSGMFGKLGDFSPNLVSFNMAAVIFCALAAYLLRTRMVSTYIWKTKGNGVHAKAGKQERLKLIGFPGFISALAQRAVGAIKMHNCADEQPTLLFPQSTRLATPPLDRTRLRVSKCTEPSSTSPLNLCEKAACRLCFAGTGFRGLLCLLVMRSNQVYSFLNMTRSPLKEARG